MGGLQVASGWLIQTLLRLFVLASGWLARSQWVANVNSFGFSCYSQWVLSTDSIGIFALCYSQWMAYVDFVGIFCYSQCVVCTDPLTLCVLAVGALHGSICFRLVLLVLFVLPVGGLGVAIGGGLRSFCCCCCRSYFSRSRPLGWAALALQRAAPKVCVLSCRVYCDLEESSIFLRLTW